MDEDFSRLRTMKMQAVLEALRQDGEGVPVTATCPVCGSALRVTHLDDLGSTWVTCDTGCTSAHFKRKPGPTGQRAKAQLQAS